MVTNQEKQIDGLHLYMTQMAGIPALHMMGRLGVIFAPALASVLGKIDPKIFKKGGKALDVDAAEFLPAIAPALTVIFSTLTPDEFTSICLALLKGTVITDGKKKVEMDGSEARFNEIFNAGNMASLYKAIWVILGINDFFGLGGIGKAADLIARIKDRLTPESNSPKVP